MGSNELVLPQGEFEIVRVLVSRQAMSVDELSTMLGVDASSLMRSIAELENMGLLTTSRSVRKYVELSDEGKRYLEIGLPEVRLARVLLGCNCKPSINEVPNVARGLGIDLSINEVNYALSVLTRLGIVKIVKGIIEVVNYEGLREVLNRQNVLNLIRVPIPEDELGQGYKSLVQEFARRGIARVRERSVLILSVTDRARDLFTKGLIKAGTLITALTPELIRSGAWRNMLIKSFDLSVPPPQAPINTKHFFAEFLRFVKEVFVSLGFEEVHGPHVELEFWNFDVLFQPQDHPAREIHDTYFLKYPGTGKILDRELMDRVARTHEDGWVTNSRGWGYRWDPNKAVRLVLRTQTTSVSARTLYRRGDGEYRVFTVDRVFRPEVLDPKHSMEFHQADGIVVGENLSFKHLLGILEALARGMGLRRVMFKPAYFPFTSPSVEGYAYHEKLGWVEFVGAGIFRPEVVIPLGIRRSRVLAFGMGLDRIAMVLMGIDDIRDLFTKDLNTLRSYWTNFSRFINNVSMG
jgi:phenylalanyl-tRNA synthetase alpha chain